MSSSYLVSGYPISAHCIHSQASHTLSQRNIDEACGCTNVGASRHPERKDHRLMESFAKHILHQKIREALSTLWDKKKSQDTEKSIPQAVNEKVSISRTCIDKRYAQHEKFVRKQHAYQVALEQKEQCEVRLEQYLELKKNHTARPALRLERRNHLVQQATRLGLQMADWYAKEAELKRSSEAQVQAQKQYQEHVIQLAALRAEEQRSWHKVGTLLKQERQNIQNMLTQMYLSPLTNHAHWACIPSCLEHFYADFFKSYALFKPSIYQMLDILHEVSANHQERLLISKILQAEKISAPREIALLKKILSEAIKKAERKLAQEKIVPRSWDSKEKIENITSYLSALKSCYAEISNAFAVPNLKSEGREILMV